MNTEEFGEYCLSLPDVTEKMPFGAFRWVTDILAFYTKGKMFRLIDRFLQDNYSNVQKNYNTFAPAMVS